MSLGTELSWEERGAILELLGSAERAFFLINRIDMERASVPRPVVAEEDVGRHRARRRNSRRQKVRLAIDDATDCGVGIRSFLLTLAGALRGHRGQDILGDLGIKGAGSTFVYPVLSQLVERLPGGARPRDGFSRRRQRP